MNWQREIARIILPLPSGLLSPNCPPASVGGRFARVNCIKKYKRLAKEGAEALQIETGPWSRATIKATFYHKTARRRDDVNHMQMLKPAYDGIVEAGLLVDDCSEVLTTLPAEFHLDREFPRVELVLTRLHPGEKCQVVAL
jgi:hypothetical protein